MAQRNILLIAAAGNNGTSQVSYPAGFAEVVSVAAIDSNKDWATFSQFNADVELAAPGVGVLSTVPTGTGTDSTLTAGGNAFDVIAMDGSPFTGATGALGDFGLGDTVDRGRHDQQGLSDPARQHRVLRQGAELPGQRRHRRGDLQQRARRTARHARRRRDDHSLGRRRWQRWRGAAGAARQVDDDVA